jgi:hypothetical protein
VGPWRPAPGPRDSLDPRRLTRLPARILSPVSRTWGAIASSPRGAARVALNEAAPPRRKQQRGASVPQRSRQHMESSRAPPGVIAHSSQHSSAHATSGCSNSLASRGVRTPDADLSRPTRRAIRRTVINSRHAASVATPADALPFCSNSHHGNLKRAPSAEVGFSDSSYRRAKDRGRGLRPASRMPRTAGQPSASPVNGSGDTRARPLREHHPNSTPDG